MTDKPYTVKEAADFLSVSPWQIRDYIKQGKLIAHKLGNGGNNTKKHWRIMREDLMKFLKGE